MPCILEKTSFRFFKGSQDCSVAHQSFEASPYTQSSTSNMFKSTLLRQVSKASSTTVRPSTYTVSNTLPVRAFSHGAVRREQNNKNDDEDPTEKRHDELSTSGKRGSSEHEGRFSRTDNTIKVEYPDEADLPRSRPVQGRGSFHFKRTLSSFSLEDRVGVVTGGARGLGLVMSQAMVVSGSNVALVDLNSTLKSTRIV